MLHYIILFRELKGEDSHIAMQNGLKYLNSTSQFLLDVTLCLTFSISCINNSDFAQITALLKPRFKIQKVYFFKRM